MTYSTANSLRLYLGILFYQEKKKYLYQNNVESINRYVDGRYEAACALSSSS